MHKLYKQVENLVARSEKILLISHRKPDADTLGAAVVLKIWFDREGKHSTLACIDKPNKSLNFLPYVDEYTDEFDLDLYDLVIVVDAGASYMTNFHKKYPALYDFKPIINIDHHASNDRFGKVNIVDPKAASTTVILYRMFEYLGIEIDTDMATCMLAGIYNDTGSFMHSNTDHEVLNISADLMAKGASVADISKALYGIKSVNTLKLWGKVLENAYVTDENVVMSVIKDYDYDMAGADPEHLTGVIDYLNMVPNTKFALLLNEDRRGHVKGSFRTRKSDVDLSRIAAVFGGGGHSKASGFMLPGKLGEEVRYTIVSEDKSKKPLDF